jgi:hypothetical protein
VDITAAITEFRRESAALRRIEQRTGARVAAGNWAVSARTRAAVARHRDALDAVRTELELAGHRYLVATLVIEAQERANLAWARRERDVRDVGRLTTAIAAEGKRVRAYVQNYTPAAA